MNWIDKSVIIIKSISCHISCHIVWKMDTILGKIIPKRENTKPRKPLKLLGLRGKRDKMGIFE